MTLRQKEYLPIALSIVLIAWTAVVAPFSKYGDLWAIYPALLVLPITLILHIWLVVISRPRIRAVSYALVHLPMQFLVWLGCLMLIGKDSF